MTDEQIAYEFVRQVRILSSDGVAVTTLTAIIAEARSTERERCAAIVERYTDDSQPGVVQVAAREIGASIMEE